MKEATCPQGNWDEEEGGKCVKWKAAGGLPPQISVGLDKEVWRKPSRYSPSLDRQLYRREEMKFLLSQKAELK